MGAVVAITGEATCDANALVKADVGFALGKTGTAECKANADIFITDDKFTSIVDGIKWGRQTQDNVGSYLQLQLTVCFTSTLLTLICALFSFGEVRPFHIP